MVRLENWSVVYSSKDGPYAALHAGRLCGKVYNHAQHKDGTAVVTSPVEDAEGRVVTTRSGTKYRLGRPDPDYVLWHLKELGRGLDEEAPVRVLQHAH